MRKARVHSYNRLFDMEQRRFSQRVVQAVLSTDVARVDALNCCPILMPSRCKRLSTPSYITCFDGILSDFVSNIVFVISGPKQCMISKTTDAFPDMFSQCKTGLSWAFAQFEPRTSCWKCLAHFCFCGIPPRSDRTAFSPSCPSSSETSTHTRHCWAAQKGIADFGH